MSGSIVKYLADQPAMQILRGLMMASRPRHIRDLATQYSLSPAGVSDIIRRFNSVGVLIESVHKNRRCFVLNLPAEERIALTEFFSIYEVNFIKERAVKYSERAAARIKWMDEAYKFYRRVKKGRT